MDEPDPRVLRAAAAGDAGAFEEVVRTYQDPLLRYLRHLLGDAALAEDVAQETFLRCYLHLDRYGFEGRFSTWLWQVARNAGIDAIRRRTRAARLPRVARPPAPATDPVTRAELSAALVHLPAKLREALLLVEVVGLRYREAAEVLGVPEGTVKSRVSHARSRLAAWMDAGTEGESGALR